MEESRFFYGVARLELHIPLSRSLKDRRTVLSSLKGRIAERSHVAVIDCGSQDFWQRGALGLCLVAKEESQIRALLASILRLVEDEDRVVVLSYDTRIGSLNDGPGEGES